MTIRSFFLASLLIVSMVWMFGDDLYFHQPSFKPVALVMAILGAICFNAWIERVRHAPQVQRVRSAPRRPH